GTTRRACPSVSTPGPRGTRAEASSSTPPCPTPKGPSAAWCHRPNRTGCRIWCARPCTGRCTVPRIRCVLSVYRDRRRTSCMGQPATCACSCPRRPASTATGSWTVGSWYPSAIRILPSILSCRDRLHCSAVLRWVHRGGLLDPGRLRPARGGHPFGGRVARPGNPGFDTPPGSGGATVGLPCPRRCARRRGRRVPARGGRRVFRSHGRGVGGDGVDRP